MRRRARECGLQILYQLDVGRYFDGAEKPELDSTLAEFWASFEPVTDDERVYAERLVRGVVSEVEAVDLALSRVSQNWKLARMAAVDRNLLRLAAYEMLWCADVPRAACINEAVEIAKRFSGQDSASFINGLLDQLPRREET